MLVLTCRIGAILKISPEIELALQARRGNRVAVALTAPADMPVHLDRVPLQPSQQPDGKCSYVFSLQGIRRFRVGPFEVGVWVPGEIEPLAASCEDFVHIGIKGPGLVQVDCTTGETDPVRMSGLFFAAPLSTAVLH